MHGIVRVDFDMLRMSGALLKGLYNCKISSSWLAARCYVAGPVLTRPLSKRKQKRRAHIEKNKKPNYGGIAADGSLIPYPNPKKIQYRMYKVLMVQPDGSTYHIHHTQPYGILKMPLDINMMTDQQKELLKIQKDKEAKEKADVLRASYEADEELHEDEWDQTEYLKLIKKRNK